MAAEKEVICTPLARGHVQVLLNPNDGRYDSCPSFSQQRYTREW